MHTHADAPTRTAHIQLYAHADTHGLAAWNGRHGRALMSMSLDWNTVGSQSPAWVPRRTTRRHAKKNVTHARTIHRHGALTLDAIRRARAEALAPLRSTIATHTSALPGAQASRAAGHIGRSSGHAKSWLGTPHSPRLKEVQSTRPPRSGSRRRSGRSSALMRSMHLLRGQPTRRSGEREQERDSMDQQGCSHRPRRTRCSAKHTWRVSGRWWRRA